MGDLGIASSRPSGDDLVMGELGSGVHDSCKGLKGISQSMEGEPSSNGKFRLQKINGCLQKVEVCPILVIQPEQVLEDVKYWSNHALI